MEKLNSLLILVLVGTLVAVARPQEKKKDRVLHNKDLSDQEHFGKDDHEHNPEYDHEAFLGQEEAKKFEELTPEQSKERLRKMVKKIDKNGDGFVSEDELKDWIKFTQSRYVWEDAERQIGSNDHDKDGYVTWDEYKNATYGFLDDKSTENEINYKDMINRDKRRFDKADADKDGKLSKAEFVAFLHPENDDSMKDIVVEETMEDIDKDKDGFLSLDEYIGDLWPEEDRKKGVEPDWVKTERDQFTQFRDTNKDGKMDKDEVRAWILPPEYDHVSSEAKHLLTESDQDKDGKLSESEIVEKYDLFVGSQATDFGEALKRHDEF